MENRKSGVMLGGTSLIMIFVIVSLTTFSLLSLVTANADLKLSKKAAASVEAYYTADAKGEEQLSALLTGLVLEEEKETFQFPVEVLSDTEEERVFAFSVFLTETQELQIVVGVQKPLSMGQYEIREWKAVNTNVADYDSEYLELWDGGEEEKE